MLTGIRNAFSKGVLRLVLILLMGLLVASFAIWGIGDIFRGQASTTVAKVGNTKLSAMTLQNNFNRELQRLGRMTGRQVTPEQARSFGIDRRILSQMMGEAAIDQLVEQMNLGMSDEVLRDRIYANPAFQGIGGKFDAERFNAALREEGLNESNYLDQMRREALRGTVVNAFASGVTPPPVFLDQIKQYQFETRVADYLLLTPAQAGDIAEPDQGQLDTYFERKKTAFRAPEYRKIVIIPATLRDMESFVTVPQDKVNAEFDRVKAGLERRQLQQIRFPDKATAEAALAKVKAGTSFEAIAEERNLKAADIDLGTVTKGEIVDAKVRDAGFSLSEGAVSDVIDSAFGPVLVRVAKVAGVDEARAKAEITQRFLREGAMDEANKLANRIEKERASGLSLADIATKVGVIPTIIDDVDASGKDPQDTVLTIPGGADVLNAAFRSEVGLENEALQLRALGGYIWYEVASLTPARERKLDEIKDKVVRAWKDDEVRARLNKKALEAVAAIKGGKSIADVGKEMGLEVNSTKPLSRQQVEGDWSASAIQMLFATPQGQAANSPARDTIDQIVFVTRQVIAPEAAKTVDAKMVNDLTQAYENDILAAYVTRLQTHAGTSIDQTLFQRATGGGEATQ